MPKHTYPLQSRIKKVQHLDTSFTGRILSFFNRPRYTYSLHEEVLTTDGRWVNKEYLEALYQEVLITPDELKFYFNEPLTPMQHRRLKECSLKKKS